MSEHFRVVVTDFITGEPIPEKSVLGDIADIELLDAASEADLVGRIEDADAVMLYHNLAITRATIDAMPKCKLIVRCGVGFDNVDRDYARSRNIPVCNIPDYGTEEVADSAIGLMLSLTRGIHPLNSMLQACPEKLWSYIHVSPVMRLRGRTFGIIGLGRIGTATALRAKALGMNVLFYDPLIPDGMDKALGITRVYTKADLFEKSFVVSAHCPLNEQTRHIVDAEAIASMPKGSYLINTSRGAVVDTSAIPEAIASGQLAGAGIDVLAIEPPTVDHPLIVAWRDPAHLAHSRVIVNPHSAFYSEEGLMDMRIKGSESIRRALLGKPLRNVVN